MARKVSPRWSERLLLLAVLAESSYLLFRGDAGLGKTTLMQWIAVQSASQCFPPELASWNGTVPFFIRLRQHVRAEGEGEPDWPLRKPSVV